MATPEELTQRHKNAIKRRMERTRARLANRLHSLGETIHGVATTVESVKETVESTAETVQDTVKSTIDTVQDTVKATVDTVQQTVHSTVETAKDILDVRRHPLAWLGGSVVAGFLGGRWLHSHKEPPAPAYPMGGYPYPGPVPPAAPAAAPAPAPEEKPGLLDSVTSMLGDSFDKVKGLGIGAAVGLLRDLVASEVPEPLRENVVEIGNNLVKDLGGQVLEGNMLDSLLGGEKKDESRDGPPADTPRSSRPSGVPVQV